MKRSVRCAVGSITLALFAAGVGGPSASAADRLATPVAVQRAATAAAPAQSAGRGPAVLDARLARVRGSTEVWVTLADSPLAAFKSARLAALGLPMQQRALDRAADASGTGAARLPSVVDASLRQALRSQRSMLLARQADAVSNLRAMGAVELGRVHVAHNAVAVRVDASKLAAIASLPGVLKVRPVVHYEMTLSETVPYIGAASERNGGKNGTGVVVAVLDSGIDYTHYNLGGAGAAATFTAAYGSGVNDPRNKSRDGLFPTAKVVGGYDFVGEAWPNGDLAPDDDPIDGGPGGGHGTHVADIIAGRSTDGLHRGVAPGASLLAVKVCSSVATSCNGVALLQGMDYVLNPSGDGTLSDSVDVVNMSLGSSYGQPEDDLSQASANAINLGLIVVVSAGNSGNRPYIVGSPSSTPGVISVAQTTVPSKKAFPLIIASPAAIAGTYANTQTLDYTPLVADVSGTVAFVGRGCPAAGTTAADPFLASPAGKIALIDRGACSVSLKVERAAQAGAIGVIIGLVAPGDAVPFSNGGGSVFVPAMVIQQSLSSSIKANLAAPVTATLSVSRSIPLVGNLESSSSRGPTMSSSIIKPDIGAPGASVSAIYGTGTGQNAFGGTSGAAPMVAGAAAIMVQARPKLTPAQIKALLMNSAETTVYTNVATTPGVLAPITRIGSGEVRVNRALQLTSLAHDVQGKSASLSFGLQNVTGVTTLTKTLHIENLAATAKAFNLEPSFRYANDQTNGAVSLSMPGSVNVQARGSVDVTVTMTIDGRKLPAWVQNGGTQGGNGANLENNEFDGYITLTGGRDKLTVPWHVLPRPAASMNAFDAVQRPGSRVTLSNSGVAVGEYDVFSLTGVSPQLPESSLPAPGDNFAIIDLRAVGVRLAEPGVLEFAISTYGRRTHPNYPAGFEVYVDTNRDGVDDYLVSNAELSGFALTGQNAVAVFNLATETGSIYYFADADLGSGNMIMALPTEALGITDGSKFSFSIYAYDNYFSGAFTDSITNMTYTPSSPRFAVARLPATGVPPSGSQTLDTTVNRKAVEASPSQSGLLFMFRQDAGLEAKIVKLQ